MLKTLLSAISFFANIRALIALLDYLVAALKAEPHEQILAVGQSEVILSGPDRVDEPSRSGIYRILRPVWRAYLARFLTWLIQI